MADPFQDLFNQSATRTPDGRYFVPFSNTYLGQMQQSNEEGGGYLIPGYDDQGNPTRTRYNSLQELYDTQDPVGGFGIAGGGLQNALGFQAGAPASASSKGTYNGQTG